MSDTSIRRLHPSYQRGIDFLHVFQHNIECMNTLLETVKRDGALVHSHEYTRVCELLAAVKDDALNYHSPLAMMLENGHNIPAHNKLFDECAAAVTALERLASDSASVAAAPATRIESDAMNDTQ